MDLNNVADFTTETVNLNNNSQQLKLKAKRRRRKHIPHSERSPEAVQKRNERERQRVNDVNLAYLQLLQHLPQPEITNTSLHQRALNVRTSKINILRNAITYIDSLRNTLLSPSPPEVAAGVDYHNRQNNQYYNSFSKASYSNGMHVTNTSELKTNCLDTLNSYNFHGSPYSEVYGLSNVNIKQESHEGDYIHFDNETFHPVTSWTLNNSESVGSISQINNANLGK